MKKAGIWVALGSIALLAAAVGYRFGALDQGAELPPIAAPSQAIYDLTLVDQQGTAQAIGQWRGKVLVLNYWATWCHPCREEMPGFSRLHDKYLGKGVQFVGISIDTADKIAHFQKETPVSYPLLIGDMDAMKNSAGLGNSRQALPFTAVFDRSGRLAMTRLGRWPEADLERQLIGLLAQ